MKKLISLKYNKFAVAILSVAFLSSLSANSFAEDKSSLIYNQQTYLGSSATPNPNSLGALPPSQNNYLQSKTYGNTLGVNNNYASNAIVSYSLSTEQQGRGAWAQNSYYVDKMISFMPFGASLFRGNFASTYSQGFNDSYIISQGDRIIIRIWGAKQYNDILTVDNKGNIFIPEVGPIKVAGIVNSNLQSVVSKAIANVFSSSLEVYASMQAPQPIGVFVTGFVNKPGQYAGNSSDSLLSYLDRAGGIDFNRGSFRYITIKRNGQVMQSVDLYDFILNGNLKSFKFREGDVILVNEKKNEILVSGLVKEQAAYELKDNLKGDNLVRLLSMMPNVSHVSVHGIRNNIPFDKYITLADFNNFDLKNGDEVEFVADEKGQTLTAQVSGAIVGNSRFPIKKTTRLKDLLSFVEIDSNISSEENVYLKRKSVAIAQKKAINDSLRRLEQSALTATSSSVDEAKIRVDEAKLIQDFVKRAEQYQPDGVVVVSNQGKLSDLLLEDGDEIIVPYKSDVVQIVGEVMLPKAISYNENMDLEDYIKVAGGFTNRANDSEILIVKANGEVGIYPDLEISGGDQIMVMPRFDSKNMQIAKDMMQILYQLAVATKVVVDL